MKIDPTSLWFLIFMVLAGGTVSYYGDILGRKLGKKRLTIHKKIRPKKFAAAMTFVFGCFGTALTIVVLFLVSEPVRTWIIEGNDAKARLATVSKNLLDTEKKFADAQSKLSNVEAERTTLTVQVNQKNKAIEDAKIEQLKLNSKNSTLDRQGKELLKKVSQLTGQFKTVNTELRDLKSQKEKVQRDLDKASTESGRLTNGNVALQQRNLELEQEAKTLETQSKQLDSEFKKLQSEFADLEKASVQANAKFNSQLKSYQDDLVTAANSLRTTLSELEFKRNELAAMQTSDKVTELKLRTSRFNRLMYPAETEINRVTIPKNSDYESTHNAIIVFLKQTAIAAKESGAEQTFEGSYAGLFDDESSGTRITVEQQIAALARALVRKNTDSVLVAASKINSFEGEFVPINIKVYDNLLAYKQGDIIFTMQIDGRKPVAEIATSIIDKIDDGLAKTLTEHNMIPILGSPRPFGEFGNEKVIEIALEIKETGIPIRLQLIASKDTYSADRIVFSHRLRP